MEMVVKIQLNPIFNSITEHRRVYVQKKLKAWVVESDDFRPNPVSDELGLVVQPLSQFTHLKNDDGNNST